VDVVHDRWSHLLVGGRGDHAKALANNRGLTVGFSVCALLPEELSSGRVLRKEGKGAGSEASFASYRETVILSAPGCVPEDNP
jgi:hypothetical protein